MSKLCDDHFGQVADLPISQDAAAKSRAFTIRALQLHQRRCDGPFGFWRLCRAHRFMAFLLLLWAWMLITMLSMLNHMMHGVSTTHYVW